MVHLWNLSVALSSCDKQGGGKQFRLEGYRFQCVVYANKINSFLAEWHRENPASVLHQCCNGKKPFELSCDSPGSQGTASLLCCKCGMEVRKQMEKLCKGTR